MLYFLEYINLFENAQSIVLPDGSKVDGSVPNNKFGIEATGGIYVGQTGEGITTYKKNIMYWGSVWPNEKVIGFNVYPDPDEFKKMIETVQDKIKIKIFGDLEYKILVYENSDGTLSYGYDISEYQQNADELNKKMKAIRLNDGLSKSRGRKRKYITPDEYMTKTVIHENAVLDDSGSTEETVPEISK